MYSTFFMHSEIQKNLSKVYLLRSVQVVSSTTMFQKQFNDKGPIKLQKIGIDLTLNRPNKISKNYHQPNSAQTRAYICLTVFRLCTHTVLGKLKIAKSSDLFSETLNLNSKGVKGFFHHIFKTPHKEHCTRKLN